jgi:hypothetical protein
MYIMLTVLSVILMLAKTIMQTPEVAQFSNENWLG